MSVCVCVCLCVGFIFMAMNSIMNRAFELLAIEFSKRLTTPITLFFVSSLLLSYSYADKFLVDHQGKPFKRYVPTVAPFDMKEDIEQLLKEKENGGDDK